MDHATNAFSTYTVYTVHLPASIEIFEPRIGGNSTQRARNPAGTYPMGRLEMVRCLPVCLMHFDCSETPIGLEEVAKG